MPDEKQPEQPQPVRKVSFDIIKPNLYTAENEIWFTMPCSEVIPTSRIIDIIIKNQIGELKVPESDLEVMQRGKGKRDRESYTVPLGQYLSAYSAPFKPKFQVDDKMEPEFRKHMQELGDHLQDLIYLTVKNAPIGSIAITNDSARLFNLDYIIDAQTIESWADLNMWKALQKDLVEPEKLFDKTEKANAVYRLDRKKTLEEMNRVYKELDEKMPDNYAELVVVNCNPSHRKELYYIGNVTFRQIKDPSRAKIEVAKSDLINALKDVEGPCLSFDAPDMIRQMFRLYGEIDSLTNNYGDILTAPKTWKERLTRLDP